MGEWLLLVVVEASAALGWSWRGDLVGGGGRATFGGGVNKRQHISEKRGTLLYNCVFLL